MNAWYEPQHRGKATGIFGAGMGGTALSAFFTPRFVEWFGYTATHLILVAALIGTGALVLAFMQDSPAWRPNNDPVVPKLDGGCPALRDLADVVPVRGDVRRLRGVQHLPADVPQGHLRLLTNRRGDAHGRVRSRCRDRATARRDAVRSAGSAPGRVELARRCSGPCGGDRSRAGTRDSGGHVVRAHGVLPRASARAVSSPGWLSVRPPKGSAPSLASSALPVAWVGTSRRW